jgi:hypothetical protein
MPVSNHWREGGNFDQLVWNSKLIHSGELCCTVRYRRQNSGLIITNSYVCDEFITDSDGELASCPCTGLDRP